MPFRADCAMLALWFRELRCRHRTHRGMLADDPDDQSLASGMR
jgi:hypothetical protein